MNTPPNERYARATTVLKQRLGDSVSVDPSDLESHSYDGMKIAFLTDAVIRPSKETEVGTVLELANVLKCL